MNRFLIASAILALSAGAQAAPVFSDNFDANAGELNAVPAGWTVTGGTVDIIGSGTNWDYIPGSGKFIDLDGSTNQPGLLARSFNTIAGMTYTATFDLAGNHVVGYPDNDTVAVSFGTASQSYSNFAKNQGWTTFTLNFTAATTGSTVLSFKNSGSDNVGLLLDNVNVAAVPEPGEWAMMLAGLGIVGFMARRRRTV